jgi:holo-[acyl-carrier protein] synthase
VSAVGLDLLDVGRLERALTRRPKLGERLFTEAERALAGGRVERLAARFCAKEAVAKALRMERWSWQDVEVLGGDGPPVLHLHRGAAARADELGVAVAISLTHERTVAAAVAIAMPK